ncbi:MAG: HAD hydrolase-like protein [Candidatus Lokiarchaeota archaeon]|nr:HAD hydrolase-like protein [Candidatus Lokiarchaeota archaeon]
MVNFEDIVDKLRCKRLFIFDFDETLINLNVDWEQLKKELSKLVKERFGITMNFTPIMEKLEYLKNQITEEEYSSIMNQLKQGEINALQTKSTIQPVGLELLKEIHSNLIQKSQESRYITILSNNYTDTIRMGAKKYGIDRFIASYVGRDMVTKIKPEIEGIEKIHKQFPDVKKSEIVYFGDSEKYDKMVALAYGVDFFLIKS